MESLVNPSVSVPEQIAKLELRDEDAERLASMIALFEPEHGTRKINIMDVEKTLEKKYPEHLEAYQRFADGIPLPAGHFSYVYQGYHALLYFRAASLVFPNKPLLEMGEAWARAGMDDFLKNPTYQMIRRASGGNFAEYCELSFRDDPFMNYGETSLHKLGSRAYEAYLTETYAEYISFLMRPYLEAVCEDFEVDAEIEMEVLNPRSLTITVSWDEE